MHAGALAGRDAKLAQETLLADADALSAEALVATIAALIRAKIHVASLFRFAKDEATALGDLRRVAGPRV